MVKASKSPNIYKSIEYNNILCNNNCICVLWAGLSHQRRFTQILPSYFMSEGRHMLNPCMMQLLRKASPPST